MGSLEIGERTRQAHAYYTLMQENMKSGKKEKIAKTLKNNIFL